MSKLDELEEELRNAPDLDSGIHGIFLTPREGLALIDLVRKKDEALMILLGTIIEAPNGRKVDVAKEALALTEELK